MDDYLLMLDCKERGGEASIPAPSICVLLLTYLRTDLALRTVRSFAEKVDYPKQLIGFYIADDGSPYKHVQALMDEIVNGGMAVYGYHNEKAAPGTPFVGRGWNQGLVRAHSFSNIVLQLEDDWELKDPLDLRPYVRLLLEREDVGMVRLSGIPVGLETRVVGHNGAHYLDCLKTAKMAYSGNPHLRHARFTNAYGMYRIDLTPGDLELNYDEMFRYREGPAIWRPADLPAYGIFGHIGRERTW